MISDAYKAKFGTENIKIAVEENNTMPARVGNFLQCMRSKQKPRLDVKRVLARRC